MDIIPAVDILGGRCARLLKGDYTQESVFDHDPVDAALRWVDMGARRLHVIDLDGAKGGVRINSETIRRIVKAIDIPIQVGGGIRTVKDADMVLQMGVQMAIFGTVAIEDPDAVQQAVDDFGEQRVCVSVDAKDGFVQTHGWLAETSKSAIELLSEMSSKRNVRNFIYTDTARDGTLAHPNFDAVKKVVQGIKYPVMVAGGIATVTDVIRLRDIGAAGAITGMAIYIGSLNLCEAIRSVNEEDLPVSTKPFNDTE